MRSYQGVPPSIYLTLLVLSCFFHGTIQQACVIQAQCSSGTYCTEVYTAPGSNIPCSYTTSSTAAEQVPYRECLTSSQVMAATTTAGCITAQVNVVTCESNSDCNYEGECCAPVTCIGESGDQTTITQCIGASAQNQDSSNTGCYAGYCMSNIIYPENFPCTTTEDCDDYGFVGYCCADVECDNGSEEIIQGCVPAGNSGTPGQYGYDSEDCLPVCLDPSDAVCSTTSTVSTCDVYDVDDATYECQAQTDSAPNQGVCVEVTTEDPTDPEEDPTDPEEDPTDPEEDPTDPEEDPTDPEEDPTDPEEEPTDPEEEPTDPEEEPTDPEEEPTDPEEEPTDPEEEPTDPEEEPTDPEEDPETDPETDPEEEPEEDPETDPETDPEEEPETDPEAEPEEEPEQDPETDPEEESEEDVEDIKIKTTQ